MKNLTLSLKKQWFEMTKAGIKSEDYREINEYWTKRFLNTYFLKEKCVLPDFDAFVKHLNAGKIDLINISELPYTCDFKVFNQNIMTLGYPKSTDTLRILKLEHKGIEIREGNPDWGAKPGKLYFVIKHGKIINE